MRAAKIRGHIRAENAAAENEIGGRLELELEAIHEDFVILIGDHISREREYRVIDDLQVAHDGVELAISGGTVPVVIVDARSPRSTCRRRHGWQWY